jgi:uncharacterized phage protein (TIGR01671 family)
MRDIEFRGKVISSYNAEMDGNWVIGDLLRIGAAKIINGKAAWYVDPETVGQFTGLMDKNGVKIFEGDIVIYRYDNYVVEYDICQFELIGELGKRCLNASTDCEVIDNKFDNKELLEASE